MNIEISVIMSVYNTNLKFLDTAVKSILKQSFINFEFIIVNDFSNDKVAKYLKNYLDKRIKIINNRSNLGLTKSLNIAMNQAKGKYIARMDSDDVSYRDRLYRQFYFMEGHPEIDMLGCWVRKNKDIEKSGGSVSNDWRYTRMLFDNVGLVHGSAFIRSAFLEKHKIKYNEDIKKAQDYELWTRCLKKGKMYVYPKVLYAYRIHDAQISSKDSENQKLYKNMIQKQMLDKIYNATQKELEQFYNLDKPIISHIELCDFFNLILKNNKDKKVFNQRFLKHELTTKWLHLIFKYIFIEKQYSIVKIKYTKSILLPNYIFYMFKICLKKQDWISQMREVLRNEFGIGFYKGSVT